MAEPPRTFLLVSEATNVQIKDIVAYDGRGGTL